MEESEEGDMVSEALAEEALALFVAGENGELAAMFDGKMGDAVSVEKVAAVQARAEQSNGRYVTHGAATVVLGKRATVVYDFPLYYERRRAHLQVAVRDDQVAGLLLRPGWPTGRWNRSRKVLRELLRGTGPPSP
ncbi:MAG TPA: hypothetical protein VNF50_08240 [Acidimicrobiales bacterium]|nr:hypothetical protein [Acidimicrobiales bacterium]